MTEIEVTQADREAAALLAEWLRKAQLAWGGQEIWFMPSFPSECRKGTWDTHDWVQAFARHRIAATAEKDAEIARLREALNDVCTYGDLAAVRVARQALGETK